MLNVGGFTPLSSTDWPGHLAAVVFVQGCPWRCHYCHNTELQSRAGGQPDAWEQALGTLRRRQGLLDGVVFSGGEPTLDPALPQAIDAVQALGFKVGLHTAGIYPDRLAEILPKLDWVGFDLKADFAQYERVTAVPRSGQPAWRSLQLVLRDFKHRGLGLEVRTTYHPQLQSADSMMAMGTTLVNLGIGHWVLQNFRPSCAGHEALAGSFEAPPLWLLERLKAAGLVMQLR